jgi:hypothetical protein
MQLIFGSTIVPRCGPCARALARSANSRVILSLVRHAIASPVVSVVVMEDPVFGGPGCMGRGPSHGGAGLIAMAEKKANGPRSRGTTGAMIDRRGRVSSELRRTRVKVILLPLLLTWSVREAARVSHMNIEYVLLNVPFGSALGETITILLLQKGRALD